MYLTTLIILPQLVSVFGDLYNGSGSYPILRKKNNKTNADTADDAKTGFMGQLTPSCVKHYHRMYVTRMVPPRYYQYLHEVKRDAIEETESNEESDDDVDIKFRIVGGKSIPIEVVPYTVLYGMYCGGSIIAPEWVITAAHCKTQEKYVIAGSSSRSAGTKYVICAHFVHPLYRSISSTHDYDYQLVLLEKPIPVTPKSRPIAIGRMQDIKPGTFISVSGWGHLTQNEQMQDHIRRVFVPIMDQETCKALPNMAYNTITPRMFCAGLEEGSRDSCQGDSGGPAVVDGRLIGLVSYGVGCAEPNKPGVYTNIPMARDWIRHITALPL